jgi:very-short-patch-repair endonuclease
MLQGRQVGKQQARRLRREMTLPEVLLWQRLRLKPNGFKFRRQHPARGYVLDFYCHEARLVVEVDGIAHDMGGRPESDERRNEQLERLGLRILRIPASAVLRDPDGVAAALLAQATGEDR